VICARLYYEWKNIGGVGIRDEGVESSKGLLLLNIVTGQKEKQKMTSVSLFLGIRI
jgi:hypothetical protein